MSRKGHVPLRRCVGCRRVRPQAELLRLVQGESGAWQLDTGRRAGGRGSWVCRDTPACRTPKRLGRTFRAQTEAVCRLLRTYAADPQNSQADDNSNQDNDDQDNSNQDNNQIASQTGGLHV